jgi:hypothetical protein
MRVILAAVAIACLGGGALALIRGNFGAAVAFACGFWMACGWFIATSVAMAAKRGDEGFNRGEEDES